MVDVDISGADINQCDEAVVTSPGDSDVINRAFLGTHKCHPDTSTCRFVAGGGWNRGKGYVCQCKSAHYNKLSGEKPWFNGSLVEGEKIKAKSYTVFPKELDSTTLCISCAERCTATPSR